MFLMNGPNRYICSVLDEMRNGLKGLNIFTLLIYKRHQLSLIEEAQSLANRMEASLQDKADVEELKTERSKLRKEIKALKAKKSLLTPGDDDES